MRLATLVRLAALGLVAALLAVLVYRLVRGPGSGIAQATKAHREPRVPATALRVQRSARAFGSTSCAGTASS